MATIYFDDRDPSIIYSSGWRTGGSNTEYNGTTMYTNVGGATAKLTFQGVGIIVYGTVGFTSSIQTAPKSSYQLDDNAPISFQPNGIAPQQRRLFYQSPRLPNKQHTLVVTNTINQTTVFVLDFITITTEDTAALSGNSQRTSVVVGSVGGVIACILLVFGVIYFWRRRKRQFGGNQEPTMVPSVWIHSSHDSHPSTTPLPPSKSTGIPSSSNHATSSHESAAPPAYTTVALCMVTTTGAARTL